MVITIFGANGKTGRLVVAEALSRGHSVRAFCHSKPRFVDQANLTIFHGGVHDARSVAEAIQGADAVICSLGSWGTPSKDILSSGMSTIIPAMRAARIRRIISVSGADARAGGDTIGFWHRLTYPVFNKLAGKVMEDAEKHIQLLEASGLDWTVIRSPVMLPFGKSTGYRLSDTRPLPWQSIPRRAVVTSMLDVLENKTHFRSAPYIHTA